VLLAETLGRSRTWLLTWPDARVEAAAEALFLERVSRRERREPVAYIVGHRAFYDLDLEVTPDVLIPRPETETLVSVALEWLRSRDDAGHARGGAARVLDIGTGSGAIALAVARHAPWARVVATDVSAAALAVAARNAVRNRIDRVEFVLGDLFEGVSGSFDLVVSNPPYVSTQEYPRLEPNVRDYEPRLALHAEEEGLAVLARICREAPTRLKPGGAVGVEIGAAQGGAVAALMRGSGIQNVRIVADLAGHDRVVWGT
jgi:release factor glutamine methyltransferase